MGEGIKDNLATCHCPDRKDDDESGPGEGGGWANGTLCTSSAAASPSLVRYRSTRAHTSTVLLAFSEAFFLLLISPAMVISIYLSRLVYPLCSTIVFFHCHELVISSLYTISALLSAFFIFFYIFFLSFFSFKCIQICFAVAHNCEIYLD